jgi:hypothetical protein
MNQWGITQRKLVTARLRDSHAESNQARLCGAQFAPPQRIGFQSPSLIVSSVMWPAPVARQPWANRQLACTALFREITDPQTHSRLDISGKTAKITILGESVFFSELRSDLVTTGDSRIFTHLGYPWCIWCFIYTAVNIYITFYIK